MVHLLQTFFIPWIQPLRRWRTKMGMHPRPSYPDRPSSEELSASKVGAQIHKVLDRGVNPNLRVGPNSLRRGASNIRVSTLSPISAVVTIMSFHCAHDLAQGLRGSRSELQDANLPEDSTERGAKHASDKEVWARRERDQRAAGRVVRR
jgi:hypothetical protein